MLIKKKIWVKRFMNKRILGPKIFWSQKLRVLKMFGPKKFQFHKFWANKFVPKKVPGPKILGTKKLWVKKNFGSEKFVGQKYVGAIKFESKKILVQKDLGSKTNLQTQQQILQPQVGWKFSLACWQVGAGLQSN